MRIVVLLSITLIGAVFSQSSPRIRPAQWAQPLINTTLENWYQIDSGLYRSEQPSGKDMKEAEAFGIRTVFNLRNLHDDKDEAKKTSLKLVHMRSRASKLTEAELLQALKTILSEQKPVLLHCAHGSDRTGAVSAAYRIAVQGWTVEAALDEMLNGGYGFHSVFQNIPALLKAIDWDEFKQKLGKE